MDIQALTPVDSEFLATEFSQAVTRLRRALQRAARASFNGESLSPTEVELLLLVAERPGIGVATAASELGAAPNTISTLIRKLVAIGLLHREFGRGDRRVARLLLTEVAEARLQTWRTQRADVLNDALAQLDDEQLAALRGALPLMETLSSALYQPRRRTKATPRHQRNGAAPPAIDLSDDDHRSPDARNAEGHEGDEGDDPQGQGQNEGDVERSDDPPEARGAHDPEPTADESSYRWGASGN